MIFGGMLVVRSFLVRVWWLTVSKALLMSRETKMVREGGGSSLKPLAMVLVMLWRAVLVEWLALEPCWWVISGLLVVMSGRIVFSRHLAMGDKIGIGL